MVDEGDYETGSFACSRLGDVAWRSEAVLSALPEPPGAASHVAASSRFGVVLVADAVGLCVLPVAQLLEHAVAQKAAHPDEAEEPLLPAGTGRQFDQAGIVALHFSSDETLVAVHHSAGVDVHSTAALLAGTHEPLALLGTFPLRRFAWCPLEDGRYAFLALSLAGELRLYPDLAAPEPQPLACDVEAAAWAPTGAAVAYTQGTLLTVVTPGGVELSTLRLALPGESGDAPFHVHTLSWTPAAAAPAALLPGVLVAGVTPGRRAGGGEGEEEEGGEAPLLLLRWRGAEPAITAFSTACVGISAAATPPRAGPYLHTAAVPAWGLLLAAHRKADTKTVVQLRTRPAEGCPADAAQLDAPTEADDPRLGLTTDFEPTFCTGLALCTTRHPHRAPNMLDRGAPPLPPGPLLLVAQSNGRLRVFLLGRYDEGASPGDVLTTPTEAPPLGVLPRPGGPAAEPAEEAVPCFGESEAAVAKSPPAAAGAQPDAAAALQSPTAVFDASSDAGPLPTPAAALTMAMLAGAEVSVQTEPASPVGLATVPIAVPALPLAALSAVLPAGTAQPPPSQTAEIPSAEQPLQPKILFPSDAQPAPLPPLTSSPLPSFSQMLAAPPPAAKFAPPPAPTPPPLSASPLFSPIAPKAVGTLPAAPLPWGDSVKPLAAVSAFTAADPAPPPLSLSFGAAMATTASSAPALLQPPSISAFPKAAPMTGPTLNPAPEPGTLPMATMTASAPSEPLLAVAALDKEPEQQLAAAPTTPAFDAKSLRFRADATPLPSPAARPAPKAGLSSLQAICADVADATAEVASLARDVEALFQRCRDGATGAPLAGADCAALEAATATAARHASATAAELTAVRAASARLHAHTVGDMRSAAALAPLFVPNGHGNEAEEDEMRDPSLRCLRDALRDQMAAYTARLEDISAVVEAREAAAAARQAAAEYGTAPSPFRAGSLPMHLLHASPRPRAPSAAAAEALHALQAAAEAHAVAVTRQGATFEGLQRRLQKLTVDPFAPARDEQRQSLALVLDHEVMGSGSEDDDLLAGSGAQEGSRRLDALSALSARRGGTPRRIESSPHPPRPPPRPTTPPLPSPPPSLLLAVTPSRPQPAPPKPAPSAAPRLVVPSFAPALAAQSPPPWPMPSQAPAPPPAPAPKKETPAYAVPPAAVSSAAPASTPPLPVGGMSAPPPAPIFSALAAPLPPVAASKPLFGAFATPSAPAAPPAKTAPPAPPPAPLLFASPAPAPPAAAPPTSPASPTRPLSEAAPAVTPLSLSKSRHSRPSLGDEAESAEEDASSRAAHRQLLNSRAAAAAEARLEQHAPALPASTLFAPSPVPPSPAPTPALAAASPPAALAPSLGAGFGSFSLAGQAGASAPAMQLATPPEPAAPAPPVTQPASLQPAFALRAPVSAAPSPFAPLPTAAAPTGLTNVFGGAPSAPALASGFSSFSLGDAAPQGPSDSPFGRGLGAALQQSTVAPFGQASSLGAGPNLFGTPQPAPPQPSLFASPPGQQRPGGLFGQPSALGPSQPAGFGQPAAFGTPSALGGAAASSGMASFGKPAAPAGVFGQQAMGGFAAYAPTQSPFAAAAAAPSGFGAAQPNAFAAAATQPNAFAAAAAQPNAFAAAGQQGAFGSGFGAPSALGAAAGFGAFNSPAFGAQPSFGMPQGPSSPTPNRAAFTEMRR